MAEKEQTIFSIRLKGIGSCRSLGYGDFSWVLSFSSSSSSSTYAVHCNRNRKSHHIELIVKGIKH